MQIRNYGGDTQCNICPTLNGATAKSFTKKSLIASLGAWGQILYYKPIPKRFALGLNLKQFRDSGFRLLHVSSATIDTYNFGGLCVMANIIALLTLNGFDGLGYYRTVTNTACSCLQIFPFFLPLLNFVSVVVALVFAVFLNCCCLEVSLCTIPRIIHCI